MFKNYKMEQNVWRILSQMNESEFEFYLTGSRFFGHYRENSDWDFFTLATSFGIDGFLKSLGFYHLPRHNYLDGNTISVYRHDAGIDVQLVESVDMKNDVQNYMKAHSIYPSRENVAASTNLWNLCFALWKD